MTTLNTLERAEAAFMPKYRPYDAGHYKIEMSLDASSGRFENTVEIRFRPLEEAREIELDCENLKVKEAFFLPGGQKLKFVQNEEAHLLTLSFPEPLPAGKEALVSIRYSGKAGMAHDGFFTVRDPGNKKRLPLYFTHFEAVSARKFFPSNDEPYDKATTEVIVETDRRYEVLSNGKKMSDDMGLDGKGKKKKTRRVHWSQEKPHSTYLVNVAIGQFETVEDTPGSVPLKIYTAPGKAADAKLAMDILKKSMKFFEDFYGIPYPWESYSMVGVPTFLWGGMENTTLTSMRESAMTLEDPSAVISKLRIVSVVTHELAHQWFGDFVTMKWWDDIWLNEAFASYMETLAGADFLGTEYPQIAAVASTWEEYFREEDGPRSHPIVTDSLPSPDDAFDSTNYTKGEQVLKMLDFYIGREAFRKGLKSYISNYALNNATYKDFFSEMEKASGEKLQGFIDGWLLKRGYPVLTAASQWDEDNKRMVVTVRQRPNHATDRTIFDLKVSVSFHRRTGASYDKDGVVHVNDTEATAAFDLPEEPEWVSWNTGGIALARFVKSREKEETLALQLLHDPDAISRLAASFDLAKSWIDRSNTVLSPLNAAAKSALNRFLAGDASPYTRAFFMSKLVDCKWPRLPDDLAETVFALAKDPQGIPPADAAGKVMVRSRAMALSGKFSHAASRRYLREIVLDERQPLDLVAGAATGIALTGDADALPVLEKALSKQGRRGWPFRKSVLLAFGALSHPAAASEIWKIANGPDANNEIVGGLLWRFRNNEVLKNSSQGAGFIRDFVLTSDQFNEQMKSRALESVEEAKDPAVRPALEEIAQKSSSERLKTLAQKILKKNFPF